MLPPVVIGIDTGNSCIKTANNVFVSGIVKNKQPFIVQNNTLFYNGYYYQLSDKRLKYMIDKSINDDYFALSLFAIGKEFEARHIPIDQGVIEVKLGIGLPPEHMSRYGHDLKRCFNRGRVEFTYNNHKICIAIRSVNVFPQGYSAIAPYFETVKKYSESFIIDIGGYTTDVLRLNRGVLQADTILSLDHGTIHLYQDIDKTLFNALGKHIPESIINDVLLYNKQSIAGKTELVDEVHDCVQRFGEKLIAMLVERGIDLSISTGIFAGGGSVMLEPYLKNLGEHMFIIDVCANAKGYEMMIA